LAPGGAPLPAKTPITLAMLREHAVRQFQPGAKVIYRTGWDRMFGRPEFFADFPTLTLEAAHWMPISGLPCWAWIPNAEHRVEGSALGVAQAGRGIGHPSRDWPISTGCRSGSPESPFP